MIRWLTGTLSRRLVLLLWGSLVASHLLAFAVVRWLDGGPPVPAAAWPAFPSLPPTPGVPDSRLPGSDVRPLRPPPAAVAADDAALRAAPGVPGAVDGAATPPPFDGPGVPRGLPVPLLAVDYGVRFIVILLAGWFGARWLAAPMRRLAGASRALSASIEAESPPARLDETRGTAEVRETAQVFNAMASRLHEQFRSRALMVAAVSHDLRTPLTRLRMRLENAEVDADLRQRSADDIREMDRLIDDALLVFRAGGPQAAAMEPVVAIDLASLLQSMVDDLAEQGEPVAMSPFEGSAVLRSRPDPLRRVIANLLGNALRYGERARIDLARDGQDWVIAIDDDGPGIPDDQLEAVFQPFVRLESSRSRDTGGSGLGLYIARDLASRLGASLNLHNREGGGLRATLRLPPDATCMKPVSSAGEGSIILATGHAGLR